MLAIPWAAALINPRRFHDSLIARLWNFDAYARRDPCRPDDSCVNPMWVQWIPSKAWEEAWGEQVSPDPGDELEVDESDAEAIEAWLLQLAKAHRIIILRRSVLRCHIPVLEVDPAVRALADLIEQNWTTVSNIRQLQRAGRSIFDYEYSEGRDFVLPVELENNGPQIKMVYVPGRQIYVQGIKQGIRPGRSPFQAPERAPIDIGNLKTERNSLEDILTCPDDFMNVAHDQMSDAILP